MIIATSPTSVPNCFIFHHVDTGINSQWWFNGSQTNTNAEISDERIKKEIVEIDDAIDKLMLIKPKEYYLCEDKDYNKKYGIVAQDINNEEQLNHLIYTDNEYVANIFSNAEFIKENECYYIKFSKSINGLLEIDDEIKICLSNDDKNELEIIIDDTPYHNRYKRRYVKVKSIIDDTTIEIYDDLTLTDKDKENFFVYGKKVDNFLKLDYSSLYTLNIKATQDLYKIIMQLTKRIEILEKK